MCICFRQNTNTTGCLAGEQFTDANLKIFHIILGLCSLFSAYLAAHYGLRSYRLRTVVTVPETQKTLQPDKSRKVLLLAIILLHALWFAAGMVWRHFYNGDSYEYIYLADSIREGAYYGANPLLPLNDYRMSLRTPVYPIWLLLFYSFTGYSTWFVLLLQHLLSISSCMIVYGIFRALSPEGKFSRIYILFLAFYPAQMFFASTLAPDTLLQFFLMLYVRSLVWSLQKPAIKHLIYMSAWLLLATLTKPIVYPFMFLHIAYAIWYTVRNRKWPALAIATVPVLAMAAYGFWNEQRTGLFHISSVQSNNLLYYNVYFFNNYQYGPAYADSAQQSYLHRQDALPGLRAKYAFASKEATTVIKQHFLSYSLYHAKESLRFFIEPGKSELDLFTGYLGYTFDPAAPNFYKSFREQGIAGAWQYLKSYPWLPFLLLVFLFNVLRVAGWLLFLRQKHIPAAIKWCCSVYILYFAGITGPVANTRYFLPVLLVLSAMAAIGWRSVLTRRSRQPTL